MAQPAIGANLLAITLPPGVFRNGTQYQAEGRWYDCNLMRFYEGALRPIGGWSPFSPNKVTGAPRRMMVWADDKSNIWVAVGTHSNIYAFDAGGGMNDITPTGFTVGRADATNLAGYGAGLYGQNTYGGAAAAANVLNPATVWSLALLEQYLVGCTVEDGYLYKWDVNPGHKMTSLSTVTTLAGGSTSAGSAVVTGITSTAGANQGDLLSGTNVPAGAIYIASVDSASQITMTANASATAVATITATGTAPINNRGVLVTDEGFLMALGANGDPRLAMWADQGSFSLWTPSTTNQAGFYSIQTEGQLMCGCTVAGACVIFTSTEAHLAVYQGYPLLYSFTLLGEGCGIISQAAFVSTHNQVAWMGGNGFWYYNGTLNPLPSDVGDYVFSRLNRQQASKIYAVHHPGFGEVTWYYVSTNSTEIDSYVLWNYRESTWNIGSITRTCAFEAGVLTYPLMVDPTGQVWNHEYGYTSAYYPGVAAAGLYAETGPVELSQTYRGLEIQGIHLGENVWDVVQMEPDALTLGDGTVSFYTRFHPTLGTETAYGPYTLKNPTDLRMSGRQLRMRVTCAMNGDVRFGSIRLDFRAGGKR
jgi:hypothetical protein